MKKTLGLIVLVTVLVLGSCGAPDEETLKNAMDDLLAESFLEQPITSDLDIPEEYEGFTLDFHSTDQRIIHNDGSVRVNELPDGEQSVDIELTLSHEDIEYTRTVTFTVGVNPQTRALYETMDELETLDIFNKAHEEDIEFIDTLNGLNIEYDFESDYLSDEGAVTQPHYYTGGVDVDIEVTLIDGDESLNRILNVSIIPLQESEIIDTRTLDFNNLATEYLLDDTTLEVHYTIENGLPYVDVKAFIDLLDGGTQQGAIDKDSMTIDVEDGVMIIEVFYEADEEDYDEGEMPADEDTLYTFTIDFNNNEATISEFNFFSTFTESTQTDFGSGLSVYDFEEQAGEPVTFDFESYQLELINDETLGQLIPLQLANLFFSGQMFDVYYNGDVLYGFDTYQRNNSTIQNTLLDSSYNTQGLSDAKQTKTYNYLTFTFDYFYGLKEDQAVETYYDVFDADDLITGGTSHYNAIFETTYGLDDLHTSYLMSGLYAPNFEPQLEFGHLGSRSRNFHLTWGDIEEMGLCARDEVIFYDNNRVALVPIAGFDENTGDEFAAMMDEVNNTAGVEKVIVDLSCNTGGIVGGMIQVLGHMTNDEIPLHYMNPTDGATSTYWYESEADANEDYDFYILSSPITYSAGNMMVNVAKEMGIATIIGEDSAGGAASIRTNILPSGAIIIMSSTSVSANSDYESTEMGIEVDISIPLSDFLDEDALLDAVDE